MLIVLVTSLLSCKVSGYEFLLDKTLDRKLKNRLEHFAQKGIEKKWPVEFEKEDLIKSALKYQGVRYSSGGITKKGMDCSGLIYASAKDIGLRLPHHSSEMARYGQIVPTKGRLRKGDLVFFLSHSSRLINHVGLMISQNEFIHVSTSNGCTITSIDDEYWSDLFLFATR